MSRHLKEIYENKLCRDNVISEAVDQAKIQLILATLEKLDGLVPDNCPTFDAAITNAKADLDKFMKGGILQKISGLVNDPIAKTTVFVNAIKTGMAQLPTVSRLYLPKNADQTKSVWDLIPQDKQKAALAGFVKSFEPAFADAKLASLFSSNSMPYVKNLNQALQELLQNVTPTAAQTAATQANGIKPPVATDSAEKAPTAAAEPTKATTGVDATQPTTGNDAAKPTTASTPQTAQQNTPIVDKKLIQSMASRIATERNMTGQTNTIAMVLNYLIDNKALLPLPAAQPAVKSPVATPTINQTTKKGQAPLPLKTTV